MHLNRHIMTWVYCTNILFIYRKLIFTADKYFLCSLKFKRNSHKQSLMFKVTGYYLV